MGEGSRKGEKLLLYNSPLVFRVRVLSPLWYSQPHRVVEQNTLRSNQTSVRIDWDIQFHHHPLSPCYRLPELAGELRNLLNETESQIQKLPAAPSDDAQGEIILLVSDFARELASYVEGTPDDNGIHQAIRPLNKTFMSKIRSTAPKFSPSKRMWEESYPPPSFLPLEEQETDGSDTIYVDEVMEMAEK